MMAKKALRIGLSVFLMTASAYAKEMINENSGERKNIGVRRPDH
jgi:hypothetical protein